MPLLIVILGIVLLLVLILGFKLNSFVAFVIVSLAVALGEGMALDAAVLSIEKGIGDTLGILVLILGLGAMLGKLVADSGAAQRITSSLIGVFGMGRVQWALMLTAFIVGVPLFYDVGFVIMMPIVFAVVASTRVPLLYVGLPTLAALSVTHGYLPPHPAPTAIATTFQADIGTTLVYGTIIAIPAIILAGPILSRGLKKVDARPMAEFTGAPAASPENMPGFWTSVVSSLLPVILIGVGHDCGLRDARGQRRAHGPRLGGQPAHRDAAVAAARHLHARRPARPVDARHHGRRSRTRSRA